MTLTTRPSMQGIGLGLRAHGGFINMCESPISNTNLKGTNTQVFSHSLIIACPITDELCRMLRPKAEALILRPNPKPFFTTVSQTLNPTPGFKLAAPFVNR